MSNAASGQLDIHFSSVRDSVQSITIVCFQDPRYQEVGTENIVVLAQLHERMARYQGLAFICCCLFFESFKSHFLSHAFSTHENENFGEIPVEDLLKMGKFGAARRIEARSHLPQDIPVDLEIPDDVLALGEYRMISIIEC